MFTRSWPLVLLASTALAADAGVVTAPSKWCLQKVEDQAHEDVFILVNLAFRDFQNKRSFPWLVQVNLTTGAQNKKGQPTKAEADVLNTVEDAITGELMDAVPTQFIGRATVRGSRELVYFTANAEKANAALTALAKQKSPRPWEYRIVKDPDWAHYDELTGPARECL